MCEQAYDGTTISGKQPWKNVTTMAKIDPFDLVMIIRLVENIWSRSLQLEWISLTDTTPYIDNKIDTVTERTNYILGTLSTEYTEQSHTLLNLSLYVINACEQFCENQRK